MACFLRMHKWVEWLRVRDKEQKMFKSMRLLSAVSVFGMLLVGCGGSKGMSEVSLGGSQLSMVDGGESTIISDVVMNRSFTKKVMGLIKEGETVELKELVGQLDAKKCQLKLAELKTELLSNEDLYEGYLESVLMVGKTYKCPNPKCGKTHSSIASGFILSDSGAFVTSYHVIDGDMDGRAETLVVMNGKGKMWAVEKVLAADKGNDFAILQLKGSGFKALPIRGDVRVGEGIRTLTHPTGHFYTMSEGIVTRKFYMSGRGSSAKRRGDVWLGIDADFCKGSSGGPILDKFGNVVGIVASTNSVYYTEDRRKGVQKNLQMVFKNVSSATNFLKRIEKE